MFYDTLKKLCDDAGTTPHAVCLALGLSQGAAPYWKKSGGTPKREVLEKIAERHDLRAVRCDAVRKFCMG